MTLNILKISTAFPGIKELWVNLVLQADTDYIPWNYKMKLVYKSKKYQNIDCSLGYPNGPQDTIRCLNTIGHLKIYFTMIKYFPNKTIS